jgi:hypothetical protein
MRRGSPVAERNVRGASVGCRHSICGLPPPSGCHPSQSPRCTIKCPSTPASIRSNNLKFIAWLRFHFENDDLPYRFVRIFPKIGRLLTFPIVLFKFGADASSAVREEFLTQIKTLKSLPCVKSQRLIVGGPSITEPIEKSKGFQYALVSYHEDRAALAAYQASSEHER